MNGILKTFIGRACPTQVVAFAGDKLFSAAPLTADQCAGNCSFVSGDVALASATIVFVLPAWDGKRAMLVWLRFGLVAAPEVYGMAVVAHFLSDVVLAALFRRSFFAGAAARDSRA